MVTDLSVTAAGAEDTRRAAQLVARASAAHNLAVAEQRRRDAEWQARQEQCIADLWADTRAAIFVAFGIDRDWRDRPLVAGGWLWFASPYSPGCLAVLRPCEGCGDAGGPDGDEEWLFNVRTLADMGATLAQEPLAYECPDCRQSRQPIVMHGQDVVFAGSAADRDSGAPDRQVRGAAVRRMDIWEAPDLVPEEDAEAGPARLGIALAAIFGAVCWLIGSWVIVMLVWAALG